MNSRQASITPIVLLTGMCLLVPAKSTLAEKQLPSEANVPGNTVPASPFDETIYDPANDLSAETRDAEPNLQPRRIGSIWRTPSGSLLFRIDPTPNTFSLRAASRDGDIEPADPPVMIGGGANRPHSFSLGAISRDGDSEPADPPVMIGGGYNRPLSGEDAGIEELLDAQSRELIDIENTVTQIEEMKSVLENLEVQFLDRIDQLRDALREQQTPGTSVVPEPSTGEQREDVAVPNDQAGNAADILEDLSEESRGWFKKLTGVKTPEPIRKIAPNGISIRVPPETNTQLNLYGYGIDSNGNVWGGWNNDNTDWLGRARQQQIGDTLYWVFNKNSLNLKRQIGPSPSYNQQQQQQSLARQRQLAEQRRQQQQRQQQWYTQYQQTQQLQRQAFMNAIQNAIIQIDTINQQNQQRRRR